VIPRRCRHWNLPVLAQPPALVEEVATTLEGGCKVDMLVTAGRDHTATQYN
jgi:hypothetical protein